VLIVKLLLEHGASPDIQNNSGQTPLAIAQRLGYISVIEELKLVTQTTLVTQTIKTTEEKYKVQTPETMQETFMSDSEDELGNINRPSHKIINSDHLLTVFIGHTKKNLFQFLNFI
jgi:ankyrin